MKKLILYFLSSLLIISCGSSKYFIASGNEFKNLSSLLKQLDKKDNADLRDQIGNTYASISNKLLNDIDVYQTLTEPNRWDKIINNYNILNNLSEVINKSKARAFINASTYTAPLQVARQNAAAEYYQLGIEKMQAGDKFSFRDAYDLLSKANSYYPGYKDVKRQMDLAWKQSVLNIVINPVTDQSSYYAQMSPNRFGNSFNSDLLQRSLVRDLGGDYTKGSPAKFFTDREAYMANIAVDWIIDITWTNLDVPFPLSQTFSKDVSQKIEVGKDTLNKPVYKTVYATLYVTRRYFTARGAIECRVTDAFTRDNVDLKRYQSQIDWSQDYATYKGDDRALSDAEWLMVNNKMLLPSREEVLLELYQKIYPQLKNGIYNLVY